MLRAIPIVLAPDGEAIDAILKVFCVTRQDRRSNPPVYLDKPSRRLEIELPIPTTQFEGRAMARVKFGNVHRCRTAIRIT